MKLTTKTKLGRKYEFVVRSGRKVVAEINRQLVGGVKMGYVPYLKLDEPCEEDGSPYCWRVLRHAETLAEAVEVVRAALEPQDAVAEVNDRVTFIGVGMTQEKADQFAAGIRRRLPRS